MPSRSYYELAPFLTIPAYDVNGYAFEHVSLAVPWSGPWSCLYGHTKSALSSARCRPWGPRFCNGVDRAGD